MNRILFFIFLFFISCRDNLNIVPIDPNISKQLTSRELVYPIQSMKARMEIYPLFFELQRSLSVFKIENPGEFRKFERLQNDSTRANFLKRNRKFIRIWRRLGYSKKELNSIKHIEPIR